MAIIVPVMLTFPVAVRFGTVRVELSKVRFGEPPKIPFWLNCNVDEAPPGVFPPQLLHVPSTVRFETVVVAKVDVAAVSDPVVNISVDIVVDANDMPVILIIATPHQIILFLRDFVIIFVL